MERLSHSEIAGLLLPYLAEAPHPDLCVMVGRYLELLARWNARVSLTSVRNARQIVQRHFGESLFLAERLPASTRTLLDFGSGAGFPGIPMAMFRPGLQVTLAESQGRKASFLREAVAELDLGATVWADRVEKMPATRFFDAVALRAVDRMDAALRSAIERVAPSGCLTFFAGQGTPAIPELRTWRTTESEVPLSSGQLVLASRPD